MKHLVPSARFVPGWSTLLVAAVLVTVIGEKWDLIRHYGTDIPFGDQWYGELATLYLPWVTGEFSLEDLFASHNEHRIVLTRLLNLGLLAVNGHWDPRLQLVVNALIAALAAVVLVAFTSRDHPRHLSALIAGFALLLLTSTSLWENSLNGFQSQFYLLILFSLLHLFLTVQERPFTRLWWLGQAAAVAALLCLSLGFIGPLAVLLWLGWRRFRCGRHGPHDGILALTNAAFVVVGLGLINFQERPPDFGSTDWTQLPKVLLHVFSWPHWEWRVGLLAQLPLFVFLGWQLARPSAESKHDLLVALGVFALLHAGAIAYARGGLGSRHADLLAIGVVTNLLCLFALPATGRPRLLKIALASIWLGWTLSALARFEESAVADVLQHRASLNASRQSALREYVSTGQSGLLEANPDFSELDRASIYRGTAEPRLREILPLSIRAPLAAIEPVGKAAEDRPHVELPGLPDHVGTWSTFEPGSRGAAREWRRDYPSSSLPFLTVFVAGTLAPSAASIELRTQAGHTMAPLQSTLDATSRWRRINFRNPHGPFSLIVRSTGEGAGISVSDPFEMGSWSRLAGKLPDLGRPLAVAGWLSWLLLSAWAVFGWLRDDPERIR